MKRVSKAVGSLYASLPSGVATLVALGFIDGAAQKWVIGLSVALAVPLGYLGVYKAPANQA